MKKEYLKPTMTVVMVQHQCSLLAGSPQTNDQVSSKPSYSRQSDWDDE